MKYRKYRLNIWKNVLCILKYCLLILFYSIWCMILFFKILCLVFLVLYVIVKIIDLSKVYFFRE